MQRLQLPQTLCVDGRTDAGMSDVSTAMNCGADEEKYSWVNDVEQVSGFESRTSHCPKACWADSKNDTMIKELTFAERE